MKETRFKQTEIGLIPEDWEIKRLGNITDIYSGGTPDTNNSKYWGGNIPWMSSGELNKRFIYDVIGKITESGLNNSSTHWIPKECILIGLAGQGKTRGTAAMNFIPLCTNQSIAAIYPSDKFVSTYIYYYIDSIYDYLRKISDGGGGRGGLTKALIGNLNIPLPNKKEQNKIASALTSIDNLLLSLDKLIEKKRLIKQGAMQKLLTGKKRLPGFTGEWVERRLGEILDYEQPIKYITNNTNYVDTGIPVLTAGKTFILGYVYENTNIYTNLPVIIFDDFTTDCKYVDFGFKVKSSAIKMLKEKEGYNIKLIFEYLKLLRYNTTEHKRQWINTFSKELVYIPLDIKEQNAISKVLSSIDKEIESLEGKKAKYERIKQGMMQQLLTGKIRLIS